MSGFDLFLFFIVSSGTSTVSVNQQLVFGIDGCLIHIICISVICELKTSTRKKFYLRSVMRTCSLVVGMVGRTEHTGRLYWRMDEWMAG